MNPSDNEIFESYVPVYDVIPDAWEDAQPFVVEQFKRLANAINFREIGFFIDVEVLSGKAFIPGMDNILNGGSSQQFRQVFRKVVDFGALPNTGSKSVPHGINVDGNFTLVFMTAAASDPAGAYIPVPYVDSSGIASAISLSMDVTNVSITTGANRGNFTRCFITIEYMQEL